MMHHNLHTCKVSLLYVFFCVSSIGQLE
ncbi:hypothetical protein BsWGS_22409 [Bradybaena similaris]